MGNLQANFVALFSQTKKGFTLAFSKKKFVCESHQFVTHHCFTYSSEGGLPPHFPLTSYILMYGAPLELLPSQEISTTLSLLITLLV